MAEGCFASATAKGKKVETFWGVITEEIFAVEGVFGATAASCKGLADEGKMADREARMAEAMWTPVKKVPERAADEFMASGR